MVRPLDSGGSGPGSSPGRGYCVLFFFGGKTLTLTASLSTWVCKWVPANCWGKT